jgi:endoglucanase
MVGLTVTVLVGVLAAAPTPAGAVTAGLIRVDQQGYLPDETKLAYLMAPAKVGAASFRVINAAGTTVLTGAVGSESRGRWNSAYPRVYPINFSGLHAHGRYRITVGGDARATSPEFTIAGRAALYGPVVADAVSFLQLQRDGGDVVPGPLGRRPSHLHDRNAAVYAWPTFEDPDSDVIVDPDLTRIGGPVNVEGGWFDAGDYLKLTHSTAFADVVLLASLRALGNRAPSTLKAEARHGQAWLDKVWQESTGTLLLQVGVGSGNSDGTFAGDHDLWRLPQADDRDADPIDRYAAAHRPVFLAAPPGSPLSPNLVGRVSAAFALAAQVDAESSPGRAATELRAATTLYAMADTASPPEPLVTALPNAFYPESTWHDDMELGAAEIALARQRLGRPAGRYLTDAATWARGYLAAETGDTFNLYDTSALAHADLMQAMAQAGSPAGLAVTRSVLVADIQRQLQTGAERAEADIFHAGAVYDDFDADSHTFGMLTTEALYRRASGDDAYRAFATEQRNWVFGANAWGVSFMVGVGTTFPHCMQHQVANLSGSTDGTAPVATGAVVNGPNDRELFADGLGDRFDEMVVCPPGGDDYQTFTGHGSRFVDDVRSWQTDEPALDMTGNALLAAALQQAT